MNIKTIDAGKQDAVVEILKNAMSTKVGLTMVTEPDMRKTGNPFYGNIVKVSEVTGHIGGSYENSLNNQLERESKDRTFEAKPAIWFKYLEGNRVVGTNKFKPMEKLYFAVKVESCTSSIYVDKATGIIVDKDLVAPFLTAKTAPATQECVDKKVVWRTVGVGSIQSMRVAGVIIE